MLNIVESYYFDKENEFQFDFLNSLDRLRDKALIVCPIQYSNEAENILSSRLVGNGLFNIEVAPIKKILRKNLYKVNLEYDNLLDDDRRFLALVNILKKKNESLSFFKNAYLSNGFSESTLKILDTLRNDMVSIETLQEMALDSKGKEDILYRKLKEIASIYSTYTDFVNSNGGDYFEAINKLSLHYQINEKTADSIIIDGFTGMNNIELKFLLSIISSTDKECFFRIILPKEKGAIRRYAERFKEQILNISNELNIKTKIIKEENQAKMQGFSKAFSKVFEYEKSNENLDVKNVSIFKARDREEELKQVAYDILSKIKNENANWSDFAVVSSDIKLYIRHMHRHFRNIPYFESLESKLSSHYSTDFIMKALKTLENDFSYSSFVNLIKSSYFLYGNHVLSYDLVSYIENIRIATETNRVEILNVDFWDEIISRDFSRLNSKKRKEKKELLKIIENLILSMLEFEQKLKSSKNVSEMLSSYIEFIKDFEIEEKIEKEILEAFEEKDKERENYLESLLSFIKTKTIEQIKIFKNEKIKYKEFLSILQYIFKEAKIKQAPPNSELMVVANIESAKISNTKYLYVIGANETLLPSFSSPSDMIFTQEDNEIFDKMGYSEVKTPDTFMDKEIFDLYDNCMKCTEKLRFSYAMQDEKNNEMRISPWLNEMLKFTNIEHREVDLRISNYSNLGSKELYLEEISSNFNSADFIMFLRNNAKHLSKHFELDKYFSAEKFMELRTLDNSVREKCLSVLKSKDDHIELSVSKLECFSRSPNEFFFKYILRANENDEKALTPLKLGILLHKTLENFVRDFQFTGKNEDYKIAVEKMHSIFVKLLLDDKDYSEILLELDKIKYFKKTLAKVTEFTLYQLIGTESSNISSVTELNFSDEYMINNKKIRLSGKIDRLDIINFENQNYIRVIDYKSNHKNFKLVDVLAKKNLQLLCYLEQASKVYKDCNYYGAFYQAINEIFYEVKKYDDLYSMNKNLKLNGILLDDVNLITATDHSYDDIHKNSKVMNYRISTKGEFWKNDLICSDEEIKKLIKTNKKNINSLSKEILDCDFKLNAEYYTSLVSKESEYALKRREKNAKKMLKNNEI